MQAREAVESTKRLRKESQERMWLETIRPPRSCALSAAATWGEIAVTRVTRICPSHGPCATAGGRARTRCLLIDGVSRCGRDEHGDGPSW